MSAPTTPGPEPVFLVVRVADQLAPADLVEPHDVVDMVVVHPVRTQPAVRVYVRDRFPHALARVLNYGMYDVTERNGVLYPKYVGPHTAENDMERVRRILFDPTRPAMEIARERFYWFHGGALCQAWKAGGFQAGWWAGQLVTCPAVAGNELYDGEMLSPDQVPEMHCTCKDDDAEKPCATVQVDSPLRARLKFRVHALTTRRGRIYCHANDMTFLHSEPELEAELETALREGALASRFGETIALGHNAEVNMAFVAAVRKRNLEPPLSKNNPYANIMWFKHTSLAACPTTFHGEMDEILRVPMAETVPLEVALHMVLTSKVPVFFFGSERLRQWDAFTVTLAEWPTEAVMELTPQCSMARRILQPVAERETVPAKARFLDGEHDAPRVPPELTLVSDPSCLSYLPPFAAAPSTRRFVYHTDLRDYRRYRVRTVLFICSAETTAEHLAYAQSIAEQTFFVSQFAKTGLPRPPFDSFLDATAGFLGPSGMRLAPS